MNQQDQLSLTLYDPSKNISINYQFQQNTHFKCLQDFISDNFKIDHHNQIIVQNHDSFIYVLDQSNRLTSNLNNKKLILYHAQFYILYSICDEYQENIFVFNEDREMQSLIDHLSKQHNQQSEKIRVVYRNRIVNSDERLNQFKSQRIRIGIQDHNQILVNGQCLMSVNVDDDMKISQVYEQMSIKLKEPQQYVYLSLNGQKLERYRCCRDYFLNSTSIINYMIYKNLRLKLHYQHKSYILFLLGFKPLNFIKQQINKELNIDCVQVYCDGKLLEDDTKSLIDYDIDQSSYLEVNQTKFNQSIKVQSLDGQVDIYQIGYDQPISELRKLIAQKMNNQQRFSLFTKVDENTIQVDYDVPISTIINQSMQNQFYLVPRQLDNVHIYIKTLSGFIYKIYCNLTDTVGNIKRFIQTVVDIPIDNQILMHDQQEVEDQTFLRDISKDNGTILTLFVKDYKDMQCYIQKLTGEIFGIDIELKENIWSLRQRLEGMIQISANDIRNVIKGKDGCPEYTFEYLNAQPQDIIHTVFRMHST